MRFAELADARSGLPRRGQDVAPQIQFEQLTGKAVHHEHRVSANRERAREAGELHLANEGAVLIEHLDPLVLAIRRPEQPTRVDADAVAGSDGRCASAGDIDASASSAAHVTTTSRPAAFLIKRAP